MALKGMSKMLLRRDGVAIATSYALFADVSALFELGDDADDRSLGYSDAESDVTYPHLRVPSETNDHVAVIAEERPS